MARASYLLIVYVFGSVALDVAHLGKAGPLPPESQRTAVRQRAFSATPADQTRRIVAAADVMASYISTEQYLWGLHRVPLG